MFNLLPKFDRTVSFALLQIRQQTWHEKHLFFVVFGLRTHSAIHPHLVDYFKMLEKRNNHPVRIIIRKSKCKINILINL
jgi:hypothetical protein